MENLPQPRRASFVRLIVPLLCVSSGVVLGLLIAKNSSTPTAVAESKTIEAIVTSPAKNKSTENTVGPVAPIQSALERLRAACSDLIMIDFAEAISAIQQLAFSELRAASGVIQSIPGDERRPLLDALAKRWVSLDANDAFTTALRERRYGDFRERLGRAAGAALVSADPEAALKLVAGARRGLERQHTARWILAAFAKTDPARAAELFMADKSLANEGELLYWIARDFGKASPQAALAWAEKFPALSGRQMAMKMAWVGWAEKDPIAAAAALKDRKGLDSDIFESVGHAWSRTDPEAALAWAQSITDKPSRDRALRSIYLDVEKLGPDKARSLVESIGDVPLRSDYAGRVAEQLAKSGDVSDALAWAQKLSDAESRARAVNQVVQQWVEVDPAAATRYAAEMPEGKDRTDLFGQAFAHWARTEPDEAFAYGQQLPPGKDRDTATARAIDAMRDDDPKKALQWFEQIEDPKIAKEVAQGLLGSLVRVDQDAALRVVSTLPPETHAEAYHGIVRGWAFDYPQEAGNWVNSLPPGQARDSAVKAYVSVIDGMDAGAATQWAYSIQDPTMRIEATMETFQRWLGNDQSAAAEWLQNTDLPEGLRPFFERELQQRRQQHSFE
jgi:hypothetical protein